MRLYVLMFDIVDTWVMEEHWLSANFSRKFPRQKKVLVWSKMHILPLYFVGQIWWLATWWFSGWFSYFIAQKIVHRVNTKPCIFMPTYTLPSKTRSETYSLLKWYLLETMSTKICMQSNIDVFIGFYCNHMIST